MCSPKNRFAAGVPCSGKSGISITRGVNRLVHSIWRYSMESCNYKCPCLRMKGKTGQFVCSNEPSMGSASGAVMDGKYVEVARANESKSERAR